MELLPLAITAAAYLAAPMGIWWYYHSKGFSLSNKQAVWIAAVNAVIIKFCLLFGTFLLFQTIPQGPPT